jgi:fibronectin-binding autotransporter adhesin
MVAVLCVPVAGWAGTVTVNCSTQNLQAKMNAASAGSTLLVSGTCVGNFVLGKSLTLKGSPHATLDGNQTGITLTINGITTVHLIALTITRGLTDGGLGGGIKAAAGVLTLDHVVVEDNYAIANATFGGGIYKAAGTLRVTSSSIVHNVADTEANLPITDAVGGGIYMDHGTLTVTHSTVSDNRVVCHTPGQCQAYGGGIDVDKASPTAHISASHFDANRATSTGNIAVAAAVGLNLDAPLVMSHSTVVGNVGSATARNTDSQAVMDGLGLAAGTPSGSSSISSSFIRNNVGTFKSMGSGSATFGSGLGGGAELSGTVKIKASTITGNRISGDGTGDNSVSGGGLVLHGSSTITGSTISSNVVTSLSTGGTAVAGDGGIDGASGAPLTVLGATVAGNHVTGSSEADDATTFAGGIGTAASTFVMKGSTVSGNTADATATAGFGASAHGGGMQLGNGAAHDLIVNSTIAGNAVHGQGPTFFAAGGGLESVAGTLTVTNVTIARNVAAERGGGLLVGGGSTTIEATIVALNSSPAGPDCRGTVGSAGHNLIGKTVGCTFIAQASDKVNKPKPGLGPLHDNGGPTATIAILAGSPALNAIPKAACAVHVDQRGVPRPQPQNGNCEIGAYERKP